MAVLESRLVRRWESDGGKYWVELREDAGGYFYRSDNHGGGLLENNAPEEAAISEMEALLPYMQYTPWHQTFPVKEDELAAETTWDSPMAEHEQEYNDSHKHVYGVVYYVSIGVEIEASSPEEALELAHKEEALENLFEKEWDRQDIEEIQVLATDDDFTPGEKQRFG